MSAASAKASASPDLTTALHPGLTLSCPFVAASGTFGYGEEVADLADPGSLGALITPTLTIAARPGNPMPRTAEASAGLLHAVGLPNPGLKAFLSERLPRLRALSCPVIVSIAGQTAGDWTQLAAELSAAGGLAALELNLMPLDFQLAERSRSAPPGEEAILRAIAEATQAARRATPLPLIAKLPSVGAEVGTAARIAAEYGADVIAVGQAFPGIAVLLNGRRFRFPGIVGGLSGPCIKPLALYQVWRAAQTAQVPLLGAGGIMTAEDALEFLLAGASAVTVGTANLVHPAAIARLAADLTAYLAGQGHASLHAFLQAASSPS
jgi:dihydroorotate dehydrogenase (NAD+) catalytic subunit